MIIRPRTKANFVALPNSLLNDKRLSADTRAMLALLFSKPKGWELRPIPLRKLLSREGEKEVGWTRIKRMFAEAMAAGYMARSKTQQHHDDGTWGTYEYFVGMPEDVLRALENASVEVAPHDHDPREGQPRAQNDFTNHKEQSSERTESKNLLLPTLGKGPKGHSREEGEPSTRKGIVRTEVSQHQVAVRLGRGDAGRGWLALGVLSPARRDALTAMQRSGHLGEEELSTARADAELAGACRKEVDR